MDDKKLLTWLKCKQACKPGFAYLKRKKTFEDFYKDCPFGDHLIWLYARTNPEDKDILRRVKALQLKLTGAYGDRKYRQAIDNILNGDTDAPGGVSDDVCLWTLYDDSQSSCFVIWCLNKLPASAPLNVLMGNTEIEDIRKRAADVFRSEISLNAFNRVWLNEKNQ